MSAVENLEIDPILGSCGYNRLFRNQDSEPNYYNYARPFQLGFTYPRYELKIETRRNGSGEQIIIEELKLHIDSRRHRVRRSATDEITKEAERILRQCSLWPPSLQIHTLQTALADFLLFGNAERIKNSQDPNSAIDFKQFLNGSRRSFRGSNFSKKRTEQKMWQQIWAELAELAA